MKNNFVTNCRVYLSRVHWCGVSPFGGVTGCSGSVMVYVRGDVVLGFRVTNFLWAVILLTAPPPKTAGGGVAPTL